MAVEPNAGSVTVGAGLLWVAPVTTAEPATGVLTPITAPAVSVAWPSGWVQLGYTEDGSEFEWAPKYDPLEVAELLIPIKYVASSAASHVAFNLAEITAGHVKAVFNGGVVTTVGGITTFNPPAIGTEVRCMLGWDRIDGMERIVWRQCINTGAVKQEHKKAPKKNTLPAQFMVEQPTAGGQPFSHYFDSSLA